MERDIKVVTNWDDNQTKETGPKEINQFMHLRIQKQTE